ALRVERREQLPPPALGHVRQEAFRSPRAQPADGALEPVDGVLERLGRRHACRQPPVSPLYVPRKRASGVLARIFRSSQAERRSTYQTSSSIRSSHGSLARPWIWAQPVRPGFTS